MLIVSLSCTQNANSNEESGNQESAELNKATKSDENNDVVEAEPQVPDTYPIYPGCTDEDYEARKACGQKKLIETLQKTIKYPAKAIDDKVNGTVLHSFVIEADGTMSNLELVKSVTPECDAAAYHAIVDLMEISGPWEPGTLDGKPAAVRYTLPIRFQN